MKANKHPLFLNNEVFINMCFLHMGENIYNVYQNDTKNPQYLKIHWKKFNEKVGIRKIKRKIIKRTCRQIGIDDIFTERRNCMEVGKWEDRQWRTFSMTSIVIAGENAEGMRRHRNFHLPDRGTIWLSNVVYCNQIILSLKVFKSVHVWG